MSVSVQLQGRFVVRAAKPPKEGEGQFATLVETESKYPVQVNVALPLGSVLTEGEVLDFSMTGTYRVFARDGRSFVTLYVEDFRAERFAVEYKPIGVVGTKGGGGLGSVAAPGGTGVKPKS
jgi:hypothetical protein